MSSRKAGTKRRRTEEAPLVALRRIAAEGGDAFAVPAAAPSSSPAPPTHASERRDRKRGRSFIPVGAALRSLSSAPPASFSSPLPAAPSPSPTPSSDLTPLQSDAAAWGLHPHLTHALSSVLGFQSFFPAQRSILPRLLRAYDSSDPTLADVCVSAPTGSGKTLLYALPLLHALLGTGSLQVVRGVILLPTRDLAIQVHEVVSMLAAGSHLVVQLVVGHTSFTAEARALTGATSTAGSTAGSTSMLKQVGGQDDFVQRFMAPRVPDIIVATPGRLMDHLDSTPDFNLRYVRFLIVDEVDRLLSDSYSHWPARIAEALGRDRADAPHHVGSTLTRPPRVALHKMAVSATLTSNPAKLAQLRLTRPIHFVASQDVVDSTGNVALMSQVEAGADGAGEAGLPPGVKYALPASLRHAFVVISAADKACLLIHLLRMLQAQLGREHAGLHALIFTNSVATAHRITLLLQLYGGLHGRIAELSSEQSQAQRTAVLDAARAGGIAVIVASDLAARGLDLPALPLVLQYDPPSRTKAYVHRVGRTARAGCAGVSYTLVQPEQMRHFRELLSAVQGGSAAGKEAVPASTLAAYAGRLERVVHVLMSTLEEEARSGGPRKDALPLPGVEDDLPAVEDLLGVAAVEDETAAATLEAADDPLAAAE